MILGIDIDGTITADPRFFADISQKVLAIGGAVHIVSSRSISGREESKAELIEYGITFTDLYLLPSISEAQDLCPHKTLDWYQRHAWLKIDYALGNAINCFVDDDTKVLALFSRYAPSIKAVPFAQRHDLIGLINA